MKVIKELIASKKFWATFTGCAAIAASNYLGIDEATTYKILGVLSAYVLGQGVADIGKHS